MRTTTVSNFPFRTLAGCWTIGSPSALAILLTFAPAVVAAQTARPPSTCRTKKTLTLTQVTALIRNGASEDHVVSFVDGCHIGFTLDSTALERLAGVGASEKVMDALNRDTLLRLSAAQARVEVAALENRKEQNQAASNADRDAALRKSDAEYQVQRDRAAQIAPKGEFETTAQYDARKEKSQADLAEMADTHRADDVRLTDKFNADLARKNYPLQYRIEFLKQSMYPVEVQPQFIDYAADASRMTVGIGGAEYWFIIQPDRARAMHDNWRAVKVLQRYEDQDSRDRYLEEASNAQPTLGRPREVVEKQERDQQIQATLATAQQHLSSQMYDQAKVEFDRVLSMDPNNQAARDGVDASERAIEALQQQQAAQQKQAQTLADLRSKLVQNPKLYPGAWYDSSTNLLWTDKDNGKDVTWTEANSFCQALTIGEYSGWRLATTNELRGLYDPRNTRTTNPSLKDGLNATLNPFSTKALPKTFPYHIKRDIRLGEPGIWSSSGTNATREIFSFIAGTPQQTPDDTLHVRTLCVHPLGSSAVAGTASPGVADAPGFANGSNSEAALTVHRGFPVGPGAHKFPGHALLRDDLGTALRKGGFQVPARMTPGSFLMQSCRNQSRCQAMFGAIERDSVMIARSDPDGTGTFRSVAPGTYFLFSVIDTGDRVFLWNRSIDLKPGANFFMLDRENASERF